MSGQTTVKTKTEHRTLNLSLSPSLTQRPSSTVDQVYDTVAVGLDLVASIADGSDILAPLAAACRIMKSILEVVQAIENNQGEWTDLAGRLKGYMSALEERITLFETYPPPERVVDKAFSQPLSHYVDFLETMHDAVVELKAKRGRSRFGFMEAFSKVKIDAAEIKKLNRDIEDRHRQFMEALSLFTALHIQAIERNTNFTKGDVEITKNNVEITKANVEVTKAAVETVLTDVDASVILQLPMVAFDASSVHSTCQKGTRKAVLQTIQQWASDDTSGNAILWLCDIAGSGKSTVAMSAMESWRREGVLGGQFFFSIASNEGSTTDKFCSTIARDLVHYIPELAPHVATAVKQNPSFMRSSLDEQFRTLITGPLHHRQGRVILVIDALDECKSGSQRRKLVETLCTAVQESKNLKVFMTSRPDPVIQSVLGSLPIKYKLENRLHDVRHRDNIDDIANYVHQSLPGVLSEDKKRRLVEKANGLFIWASTACRMLNKETSLAPPDATYNRLISMDQAGAVDDLYSLIFERTDPEHHAVMYKMLALLLAAFEPLTANDLDDMLKHAGIQGSAKALVRNLGSVLTEDEATNLIQFRHPTLVEYLRRSSKTPSVDGCVKVYINIAVAHGQAASWCLKYLKSRTEGLKFNICEIESSFYLNREIPNLDAKISRSISRRLRYASSHWLFHLAETDDHWRSTLTSELRQIIQIPYVLYWTEILSLTGRMSRAIAGLRAMTRHAGLEDASKNSLDEIRRFLIAFTVPIQDSVPHIYISALPFTPIKSKLHLEGAKRYINTLSVTRGLEDAYPEVPSSLRGHDEPVTAVTLSPDGARIVSSSSDNTIRFWDADSGQPLGEPLRGHGGSVTAVTFSPDGSRIVSSSNDKTLRLWDANTGQPVGGPLRGHEDVVLAVAFSPSGQRIASGSQDKTIRLWNADTGRSLGEPLRGHEGSVNTVAFSPDSLRVVSGSRDNMIRFWDANTGQSLGEPVRGHEGSVNVVTFSRDGSQLISGSRDNTIRLWDPESGQSLGDPFRGHEGWVNTVAFSPDGSRVVSGSRDNTIRLVERWVNTVTFSPDGSRIVSGSSDKTIRLWNAETGQSLGEPHHGHEDWVRAVAFSPDGSQIVSSSNDTTIRLWDEASGQSLGNPLYGHKDWVLSVAFSPSGLQIVSGSNDKTIRLWDANTGQPLGEPFYGHKDWVMTVAFSPDGSRIVSGSRDETIRLWNTNNGQSLGEPLLGHEGSVNAIAFSPDGLRIASGSDDRTIRLWDAHTGQAWGEPLRGHEYPVFAIAFSPDSSRIVSGSFGKELLLWDVNTGQPSREPLDGHEDSVWAVAFSPDGLTNSLLARMTKRFVSGMQILDNLWESHSGVIKIGSRLVSGSSDKTIRLWDVPSGQLLGEPLPGHGNSINTVAFSPDGSKFISGSSDKTIRVWDADTDANENSSNQDDRKVACADFIEVLTPARWLGAIVR
ncbi:hypothetical protein PIIN_10115 [Serendipita indica DSM 11827]|uniref:Nephrocystin 3-like N-terminal domain-containing protein n=1 Tax=Serendipita indica (strain DSM 11827) TaxID=1109443 RepID=G4TXS2_SERID|nr:hypothetical protein PIIN_10115 [Serendipita indica DSM 11827]